MIITISGQPGSGKSTAATLLAQRLGYRHYSIGDLRRRMAAERGITLAALNTLGETTDFTDRKPDEYQRHLGEAEDNFVIDSRLGFYFIPHSVKVFLKADLAVRAQRVFQDDRNAEQFATLRGAATTLHEREASDTRRYRKYYHIDWTDEKNYDLVVDTTALPPEDIVEHVLAFLRKKRLL